MSNIWFHEIADKWALLRQYKYQTKIWNPISKSTNISAQSINVWFFSGISSNCFSLYHTYSSPKNRNRHGMRYFIHFFWIDANLSIFSSLFCSFIHAMVWRVKWNKNGYKKIQYILQKKKNKRNEFATLQCQWM